MSNPLSEAAINNFRRTTQNTGRSCFGSIVRGLSNFWIGFITSEARKKLSSVGVVYWQSFGAGVPGCSAENSKGPVHGTSGVKVMPQGSRKLTRYNENPRLLR